MSERAAFVSAILDNLADDTPRLVFADWLQEHGEDERAEFIRAQIEAAKLPEAKRAKSKPGKRAKTLENQHAAAWHAALRLALYQSDESHYDRGFLRAARVEIDVFEAKAAEVLAVEPAHFELELRPTFDHDEKAIPLKWVAAFAKLPALRAVTTIISQGGFGEKRFARLITSPHFAALREIGIFGDRIGAAGVKAIANSPSPFVLELLDLTEALDDDDGGTAAVKVLAASPRFASLRHLGLSFNSLTDKHIRALIASKTLPKTMSLDLEDNDYDEERFAEALAERFTGGSGD